MWRILLLLGILIIGVLLFACTPKSVAVEKPSTVTATSEAKERSPASEWDKFLAEARKRKEGKVVMYTGLLPTTNAALRETFFSRTGIELETIVGRGPELTAKLLTERRNGLFLVDAYIGGTTPILFVLKPQGVLAPLEPALLLPEVVDTKLWFNNELPWVDKDRFLVQTRMTPGGGGPEMVFNTNFVREGEIVSWYDLLNPKFKGKMNLYDPTVSGPAAKFVNAAITYFGLDWDYMSALARQEPVLSRDKRVMIEWVAKGKHMVSLFPGTIYEEFKAAGAPVGKATLKETRDILGGGASGVVLIDRAPHPNAAKLFINWFLSKEGQALYARSHMLQSAREDVPTDHLAPENIRRLNVEYVIETEEYLFREEKFRPKVMEIFGPLVGR